MKVLSFFHLKGGVGKTTSAVNLAYLAAEEGARVLFWDLDPQSSATYYFRIKPEIEGGVRGLVEGDTSAEAAIRASDFPNLDVLPGAFSYRKLDHLLGESRDPEQRFASILDGLETNYDLAVLDCAPTLSVLTNALLARADAVLCPTIPTPLSLRALAQLMRHLKRRFEPRPLALPFFSMVDRRKLLHRRVCTWVQEQDLGFLENSVPYSSVLERMSTERNPVFSYAGRSPAAGAFAGLWNEVRTRLAEVAEPTLRNGHASPYDKRARRGLEEAVRLRGGRSR